MADDHEMVKEVVHGDGVDSGNKHKEEDVIFSVELPAPSGWTKKFIPKKGRAPGKNDIIFIAPTGDEIKSKRQLDRYLKSHPGGHAASEFDWGFGETPRRSARISEKVKATEPPEEEPKRKRARKLTSSKLPDTEPPAEEQHPTHTEAEEGKEEPMPDTEGIGEEQMPDAEDSKNEAIAAEESGKESSKLEEMAQPDESPADEQHPAHTEAEEGKEEPMPDTKGIEEEQMPDAEDSKSEAIAAEESGKESSKLEEMAQPDEEKEGEDKQVSENQKTEITEAVDDAKSSEEEGRENDIVEQDVKVPASENNKPVVNPENGVVHSKPDMHTNSSDEAQPNNGENLEEKAKLKNKSYENHGGESCSTSQDAHMLVRADAQKQSVQPPRVSC